MCMWYKFLSGWNRVSFSAFVQMTMWQICIYLPTPRIPHSEEYLIPGGFKKKLKKTEFNTITFYCILGIISNSDGLCFCGVVSGPENVSYFIVIFNLLYIHVLQRKVDRKSKIPIVMALMKKLTWCSVVNNFNINAKHIPGKYNNIAYAISRFQMKKFRNLAPNAKQEPTLCVTFQQLTLI